MNMGSPEFRRKVESFKGLQHSAEHVAQAALAHELKQRQEARQKAEEVVKLSREVAQSATDKDITIDIKVNVATSPRRLFGSSGTEEAVQGWVISADGHSGESGYQSTPASIRGTVLAIDGTMYDYSYEGKEISSHPTASFCTPVTLESMEQQIKFAEHREDLIARFVAKHDL